MPDLAGHISELEMMHEVSVGEIDTIILIMVLFYLTNKLKTTELTDAETNPTNKLQ